MPNVVLRHTNLLGQKNRGSKKTSPLDGSFRSTPHELDPAAALLGSAVVATSMLVEKLTNVSSWLVTSLVIIIIIPRAAVRIVPCLFLFFFEGGAGRC